MKMIWTAMQMQKTKTLRELAVEAQAVLLSAKNWCIKHLNDIIKWIVKYLPVVVNLWIILILTYTTSDKYYPFLGHSIIFDVLLFILSLKYHFCGWHRALILSMAFCVLIEFLNNERYIVLTCVSDFQLSVILIGMISAVALFVYERKSRM